MKRRAYINSLLGRTIVVVRRSLTTDVIAAATQQEDYMFYTETLIIENNQRVHPDIPEVGLRWSPPRNHIGRTVKALAEPLRQTGFVGLIGYHLTSRDGEVLCYFPLTRRYGLIGIFKPDDLETLHQDQ